MRTIFHIGTPKTGTTALQNSLHAARPALDSHGVLYPSLADLGHLNHHPLILGILPPGKLPRQFRFLPEARRARLAARAADSVARQIAARAPEGLLLSSEYFSRDFAPDELARLRALLDRFGVTDLTFAVYVRQPSALYLSLLTQALRQSATIRPLEPFRIRHRIEPLAAAFPEARIVPALFARESLAGGDIVSDVVTRFLAPFGLTPADVPSLAEANVSVSGEATAILQSLRRDFFPGRDHRPERASTTLFAELARIEAAIGPRRPRLRPEIARYIDRASGDAPWLRETYGLELPGDDDPAGSALPERPVVRDLSDVLDLDPAYRAALLAELIRSPWARKPWRRDWVRALAAGTPPRVPGRFSLRTLLGT